MPRMAGIPTGTVTFLFTDLEASTRMWEEHTEAMEAALERHDAIMREAIDQHGGYVFSTAGDAFAAAFGSPASAAEAALIAPRSSPGGVVAGTGPTQGADGPALGTGAGTRRRLLRPNLEQGGEADVGGTRGPNAGFW